MAVKLGGKVGRGFALIVITSLIFTASAKADYYTYVDKNGSVVFTDDPGKIPDEQRSKAQRSGEKPLQEQQDGNIKAKKTGNTGEGADERQEKRKFIEMIEKSYNIKVRENCPPETKDEILASLESAWKGMSKAFISGDLETAVTYFSVFSRDEYRRRLSGFSKDEVDAIFRNVKGLVLESLSDDKMAECGVIREEKGAEYSYPVSFVKDPDCVWRIRGF